MIAFDEMGEARRTGLIRQIVELRPEWIAKSCLLSSYHRGNQKKTFQKKLFFLAFALNPAFRDLAVPRIYLDANAPSFAAGSRHERRAAPHERIEDGVICKREEFHTP